MARKKRKKLGDLFEHLVVEFIERKVKRMEEKALEKELELKDEPKDIEIIVVETKKKKKKAPRDPLLRERS